MIQCVFGMVIAIFLLAGVTPGWSQQYYLYTPKPVAAEEKVQKKDGVLVKEVSVRKGDTLYKLSRKFSGHGSYFPQILLFNDIKDPDKIYPGNVFKIPVSDRSADNLKKGAAAGEKKRDHKYKAAARTSKHAKTVKQPTAAVAATSEQRLFERAIKAYRQDDYRTALKLFDRFLADYPSSALAADASLYKAECYLKQSNQ